MIKSKDYVLEINLFDSDANKYDVVLSNTNGWNASRIVKGEELMSIICNKIFFENL